MECYTSAYNFTYDIFTKVTNTRIYYTTLELILMVTDICSVYHKFVGRALCA